MYSWVTEFFSRKKKPANQRRRAHKPSLRMAVENLEDRRVPAAHLQILPLGFTSIRAGDAFASNVVVRAFNETDGVPGLSIGDTRDLAFNGPVRLEAIAVGGSDFDGAPITVNGNGTTGEAIFTAATLKLLNAANTYHLEATSAGLTTGISSTTFNVTARTLTITNPAGVQSGVNFAANIVVTALDAQAVPAPAENAGDIQIDAFGNNEGIPGVGVDQNFVGGTKTLPSILGSATFLAATLRIDDADNNYAVRASAAGLTVDSAQFIVSAADILVSNPANIRAGSQFAADVTVTAVDANGNRAEDTTVANVTLKANGDANFVGGDKSAPMIQGVATFANTTLILEDAGNGYTVEADAGPYNDVSTAFNVTPASFLVSTPANVKSGANFAANVTVTAYDAQAVPQIAEDFTDVISLEAVGGAGFPAVLDQAAILGTGTATFLAATMNVKDAADNYFLRASSGSLIGVSGFFNVTASRLIVVTAPVTSIRSGTTFAVTVEARDENDVLAENYNGNIDLNASAPAGGANFVGGAQVLALANGTGTTPATLHIDNAADDYKITATDPAVILTPDDSNLFDVTANQLVVTTVPAPSVKSGVAFQVQVQALDALNLPAENFTFQTTEALTLTLNVPAGGSNYATVPTLTLPVNNVTATATYDGAVINNAATGYTITASGNSSGVLTTSAASAAFDVTASRLIVVTAPVTSIRSGTTFAVTVEVRDENNVLAENYNGNIDLNASAPAGGANFVGGAQVLAIANGTGTTPATLHIDNAADDYKITATDPAAILTLDDSDLFDVTANQLVVTTVPAPSVKSGVAFQVQVQALDALNLPAENFTFQTTEALTLTLNFPNVVPTNVGSNYTTAPTLTLPVNNVTATATYSGAVINNAANGYTITASGNSSGVLTTSAASAAFDVTASRLFVVTAPVTSIRAGTTFAVTVEARDENNVLAENYNGNIDLNASAPAGGANFVGGAQVLALANGTGTTPATLHIDNAADNYEITATDPAAILTLDDSDLFDVTANQLVVTTVPAPSVKSGVAFQVQVQALDALNLPAENFTFQTTEALTLTLNVPAGGSNYTTTPTLTLPVNNVTATATYSGAVINNAANGYTITASGNSSGVLTTSAASAAFDVTASRLFVVTAPVTSIRAGTTFAVTVEARDENNVLAENYNGNIDLNASAPAGGANFVGGAQILALANGTGTTPATLHIDNAADNYEITATDPAVILTPDDSNLFDVTANQLVVTTVPAPSVKSGVAFQVQVQALDALNLPAENFTFQTTEALTLTLNVPAGGSNYTTTPTLTLPVNNVTATATYTGGVIKDAANGYTITASGNSSGALVSSAPSVPFAVTASKLIITRGPGSLDPARVLTLQAGTAFDVTVRAIDETGGKAENFNGNINVDAVTLNDGANFTEGTQVFTLASGERTKNLHIGNAADEYKITAVDPDANAARRLAATETDLFDVTAKSLRFTLEPAPSKLAGEVFIVRVQALDGQAIPQPAENFTFNGQEALTLDLNVPAGGSTYAVAPTLTSVAAATATATYSGIRIDDAANAYSITASGQSSGANLVSDTTAPFNITASRFKIIDAPARVIAGRSFAVRVQALDARAGDLVAENFNLPIVIRIGSSVPANPVAKFYDGNGTNPTATKTRVAVDGNATFSVAIKRGGNHSLQFVVPQSGVPTAVNSKTVIITASRVKYTILPNALGKSGAKFLLRASENGTASGDKIPTGIGAGTVTSFDSAFDLMTVRIEGVDAEGVNGSGAPTLIDSIAEISATKLGSANAAVPLKLVTVFQGQSKFASSLIKNFFVSSWGDYNLKITTRTAGVSAIQTTNNKMFVQGRFLVFVHFLSDGALIAGGDTTVNPGSKFEKTFETPNGIVPNKNFEARAILVDASSTVPRNANRTIDFNKIKVDFEADLSRTGSGKFKFRPYVDVTFTPQTVKGQKMFMQALTQIVTPEVRQTITPGNVKIVGNQGSPKKPLLVGVGVNSGKNPVPVELSALPANSKFKGIVRFGGIFTQQPAVNVILGVFAQDTRDNKNTNSVVFIDGFLSLNQAVANTGRRRPR